MKHGIMIRSLTLILAGVMLTGSPLKSFAAEADPGIFDGAMQDDLSVDDETEKEDNEIGILSDDMQNPEEKMPDDGQSLEERDTEQDIEEKKPENEQNPEEAPNYEEKSEEMILPDEDEQNDPEDGRDKGHAMDTEVPADSKDEEHKIPVLATPTIARLSLDFTSLTLPMQGTPGILKVKAYDETGKEIETGVSFAWNAYSEEGRQIITIDTDGSTAVLTARASGKATVEVRAGGKTAVCNVEVIIPINSVSLDKTSLSMKKKQVTQLTATVLPADATVDTTLKWKSSNTEVAYVDNKGRITAVAFGTTNITAETSDGHRAVCQVTVLDEDWRTGWHLINNNWYYYNEESVIQTGWQNIEGKYYYLDANGMMQTGWVRSDGNWYYLNTGGDRRSGWLELNKKWYYLDSNGLMQTGLIKVDGHIFYFNGSGEMRTGWQKVSNKWYYLDYRSGAQIGWKKIGSKWYYFDINGEMQTGWQKVDNIWYYLNENGEMQTGWQKINNKWYYLLENGAMQTGWLNINNVWYYMNVNGAMRTGWQNVNNVWYYMNGSGVMQTGWQKISNKWYYLGSNGAMRTDWQKVSNKWYYFNRNGAMQTGWQNVNNVWYYMNGSGVMQTDWQKISNKWYYLGGNGAMRINWQKVSNKWYYFNRNGVMQSGWQKINNDWYYMNASGEMQTGWIRINDKHYYLSTNGVMQTGWQPIGGNWYYLNTDGSMKTGWVKSGSKWYYLKSNGSMATSDTMIDGKNNSFDGSGVWQGIIETKIRAYGIDVSSHQGTIDWKKVARDDIDFAMLRVVSGRLSNMQRDTTFKENYDGARDAGLKVGAYKFCYATSRTQARKEADAVISALNGRKLDYPIVLDVEDEDGIMSNSISNARRTEIILAFKKEIEDAGYKFALYANLNHLNTKLEDDLLKDVDIWIARYRDLDRGHGYNGEGNVVMWQYSSTGSVNGISGNVDLNVSYKKY